MIADFLLVYNPIISAYVAFYAPCVNTEACTTEMESTSTMFIQSQTQWPITQVM